MRHVRFAALMIVLLILALAASRWLLIEMNELMGGSQHTEQPR